MRPMHNADLQDELARLEVREDMERDLLHELYVNELVQGKPAPEGRPTPKNGP